MGDLIGALIRQEDRGSCVVTLNLASVDVLQAHQFVLKLASTSPSCVALISPLPASPIIGSWVVMDDANDPE